MMTPMHSAWIPFNASDSKENTYYRLATHANQMKGHSKPAVTIWSNLASIKPQIFGIYLPLFDLFFYVKECE